MKKVLVVLLIGALLLGAIGAAAGEQEETSPISFQEWSGENPLDYLDATPCGGGNGDGGAPG